jgi:predicted RNA-binding protein with PIN domain
MIIIVDAYNLLRAMPPYKKVITDQERKSFIARLGQYGRSKGHKMVIVFDGGPYEWPNKEHINRVLVVYSGIHESADDYIKEYLDAHKSKDILLVSSDAELNAFGQRLNIPSIDSSSFMQLLWQGLFAKKRVTSKQDEAIKLVRENESDIDQLMTEASKSIPVKSEDLAQVTKDRMLKKPQTSKQERALLKKLNKL